MAGCAAYLEGGWRCDRPAVVMDEMWGGMVCEECARQSSSPLSQRENEAYAGCRSWLLKRLDSTPALEPYRRVLAWPGWASSSCLRFALADLDWLMEFGEVLLERGGLNYLERPLTPVPRDILEQAETMLQEEEKYPQRLAA